MFASLFLKECKQMLKCLTYYVILVCMLLYFVSQLSEMKIVEKPMPGKTDYGFIMSDDENVIMRMAISKLAMEFVQNNYITYPLGFYKTVKLKEEKQSKMGDITEQVTGLTKDELILKVDNYLEDVTTDTEPLSISVAEDLTYDNFKELMKKADKLIGKGSQYSETNLKMNSSVPMTYEQAIVQYNNVITKDHLSGAYARLFCDYMGLILAILPVFIAVTRGLRDRRAKANEIIYSRRMSSFHLIMTRYLAMLAMLLLPLILISIIPITECIYYASNQGITLDNLSFLKYIFGWLMPTIMVSLSVGMFFTELTDSAIAIIIQGLWWFISLFTGIENMGGGYGWNLMPRHNTEGNYQVFHDNFNILVKNRITYSILAVILVLATVYIYEMRRRGKLKIGKIRSNRKSESEE